MQAAFYAACLKRSLPTRCHSEPPRMRRGGKVPLPYSASRHYCIIPPIARTALCFHTPPPLSFRLSERQRTHGEISHFVRLFLQCTLARIHFSTLYIIPRRFLDCARAASCRGRIPCSAQDDNLRGLLKTEFADARFYFLSTRCTAKPPKSSERYATLGLPLASYFIELSSMVKPRAFN